MTQRRAAPPEGNRNAASGDGTLARAPTQDARRDGGEARFLTRREAAAALGVSYSSIVRLERASLDPIVRDGRYLFRERDVLAFATLSKRRVGAPPPDSQALDHARTLLTDPAITRAAAARAARVPLSTLAKHVPPTAIAAARERPAWLITRREAARIAGVGARTIRRLVGGELTAVPWRGGTLLDAREIRASTALALLRTRKAHGPVGRLRAFDAEQLERARARWERGDTIASIAREFGVNIKTVGRSLSRYARGARGSKQR